MREQAFIEIKPGFTDSGASPRQTKPIYSVYTPPTPKKKKKVERTRFRESTRTFRQKSPQAAPDEQSAAHTKEGKKKERAEEASMKPGKKEKIRYGQAPIKTLPEAPQTQTEDAGGGAEPQTASSGSEPVNPLETNSKPTQKTRYSARPKVAKQPKIYGPKTDTLAPVAADSTEAADRQTQAGPLGLAGDTSKKKKKKVATTTSDKTRLADKKKTETPAPPSGDVPLGPAPQTPAPAPAPAPQQ
jgi:peptidyl-prolyl cis-trans isomerase SurA